MEWRKREEIKLDPLSLIHSITINGEKIEEQKKMNFEI